MKKFLALILTLGFVGSMAARGCCGSCGGSNKTTEKAPNCEIMVPKKVCAKRHVHVSYSCPTEHKCPVTGKQVQVRRY